MRTFADENPSGPVPRLGRRAYLRAVPLAVTVAAVVTLVGVVALPWLRSGSSRRTSFELFGLIDRLGFTPDGGYAWAVRLWPLEPLLVVAAVVSAWWGRTWWTVVFAAVSGAYAVGVGVGTSQAPDLGLIGIEAGPTVAAVGGGLLVFTAVATALGALVRR